MAVWPLLFGQVEMDGVTLDGLEVNLVETADGANWEKIGPQDGAEEETAPTEEEQPGESGGMDIPLVRRFQCGFEQGIKYASPNAELITNMTGTTPAAWNDPGRGAELAKGQFDRGVDVVYAAAGSTGLGILQAAKDRGKLGIGVDSNQNHLHPGNMRGRRQ